jgi:single-stranded-DNA-specific exonuclease
MPSLQPTYEISTAQVNPDLVAEISFATGLPLVVARILALRAGSLEEATAWLKPLEVELADPFTFSDMGKAVDRILQAIKAQEHIIVYGDYDVDGITATIVMLQALEAWGAQVSPFFPDRFEEGYGLSIPALERCLEIHSKREAKMPSLIVTVDCGITSVKEVAWLKERNIEVVVTDHHMPLEELPDAVAVVNPRLEAHPRATEASGCATAFAVVRALEKQYSEPFVVTAKTTSPLAQARRHSDNYIDLVAVSIISDVMMITGDNRALVLRGLQMLTQPNQGNVGLKALLDILRLRKPNVSLTAERIAFSICPCINAAGRLGRDALKEAFRLLMLQPGSENLKACAQILLAFNEKRRKIEHDLTEYIKATYSLIPYQPLAIAGEGEVFHPGVIGIVAARLMEHLHAPVAVIKGENGGGHGSMRAGEGYNAIAILKHLEPYLDHFGGHAQAAGFTIKEGCCKDFCEAFASACEATREDAGERPYIVDIDLSMEPITLPLCTALTRLEPFGHGNPRPLFVKRFELRSKRVVGVDGAHLSLYLRPDDGGPDLKAVWFNGVELAKTLEVGDSFRAIFSLDVDTYNPDRPLPSVRIIHCI